MRSYGAAVSATIAPHEEDALRRLRTRLLSDRPPPLQPEHGHLAFMSHVLLASAVHTATRLDQYGAETQTGAWTRYLSSYFPAGKNSDVDARLLWTDWRTALLKKQAPGLGVLVTHGQSAVLWRRDEHGRLCIYLEDMWADFESSVSVFIEYLRKTPDRRGVALRRAQESSVAVIEFTTALSCASAPVSGLASGAQIATASAVAYMPPRPPGSV